MKKGLLVFLGITAMAGGTPIMQESKLQNDENSLKEHVLNVNNIYQVEYQASYVLDYKNLDEMYDGHEFIALIHVDKLHPATTYREKTDEYIMPFTPGEATVLKVLKGNFESKKISFLRLGGVVSFDDYKQSLYPEAREKFDQLFDESVKSTTYINNKSKNDIDIENGKTYLVYMNRSDDFHNKNEYTIEAYEYGLREVNTNKNTLSVNSSKITIKNNETGSYEQLENAVSKEILQKFSSAATE